MPQNIQTTSQFLSFHMLVRLCLKYFKLGFSSSWTENFQIYKLESERGRGTRDQVANICWIVEKARKFQKNTSFCFTDYTKPFDCVDLNELWEILKQMGIPYHFICLLRNLYAGQEATVGTRHGTTDWFKIGKGVRQGCVLSLCIFNLHAQYITQNASHYSA